jgi:predicted nucleic acid-binding Zn ribbon protein
MVEYFQSMSDAPKKECLVCKEDSLRRVISGGTGLIFKGSGYYLTDYKNKKNKSPEKKDTGTKKKKETSKKKIES